ncbi:L-asparaginase 1 [Putridiphycobacter roseus]|uniref:L-asparaginase 1 n=1 Tax=Putridiphycobacter roseus TaxID=2219161 RepID=A0A2W1N733_9FLAO|nr:asparaginase [Putridiphycobacter roseus]PZE18931.1 L-asparaginase 1 [Putridiphycobacter roseus]
MEHNPKVLIIYTGGTIGMINDPKTGALKSINFKHLYNNIPELKQIDYQLDVISFDIPIDSSEMNASNWTFLANLIATKYEDYDGFVILHGSDTMAYTASALSFMLLGLKKPVILTGSQLPIGKIRTDGKENLITAIEIAGLRDIHDEPIIQEVAVYFEYHLYRGNRASKISANAFEAFDSPNYPNLAVAGVEIEFDEQELFRTAAPKLEVFTEFNTRVGLVKLFPSMSIPSIKGFFDFTINEAIVLETFGSGNMFSSTAFNTIIADYIEAGGLVLNITQCMKGKVVFGKYETSEIFKKLGVINGVDLTTEAALAKLMYVLGRTTEKEERIELLNSSLCGEMLRK